MSLILRAFLPAIAISLTALPAQACYKVELKNTSNARIAAVWSAAGCFKTYDLQSLYLTQVCTHKIVHSDDYEVYNYKWGTTLPIMNVVMKNESGRYIHIEYTYDDERFKAHQNNPHTVPHCGLHYKVTFNQTDWESQF